MDAREELYRVRTPCAQWSGDRKDKTRTSETSAPS